MGNGFGAGLLGALLGVAILAGVVGTFFGKGASSVGKGIWGGVSEVKHKGKSMWW